MGEEKKKRKRKSRKPKLSETAAELRLRLDSCSKTGDVMGAIELYDSATREGIKLEQYHYNVLLYLCSSAACGVVQPAKSGSGGSVRGGVSQLYGSDGFTAGTSSGNFEGLHEIGNRKNGSFVQHHERKESNKEAGFNLNEELEDVSPKNANRRTTKDGISIQISEEIRDYARTRGFEIYEKMCLEKIPMSEAALTSVARMAASMGKGEMAFQIVKEMKNNGVNPRLRSYGPALFTFCNNGGIDKAFEVEAHMLESEVYPEEDELAALLKASIAARRGDKVYYLLHKLRTKVRQVSPLTAELIESWFKTSTASKVGKRKWNAEMVAQSIENGGGGWHGLGWLGKGKWTVSRTYVDSEGVCVACGEKLATIDLDPIETENFARSVASVVNKREKNSNFEKFQKWLDYYGPFEAVIDAANVGLSSQKRFSINRVNAVVNATRQKLPMKKWPLIIVHNKRLTGSQMNEPTLKIIQKWRNADAIYATPTGSNDDWYWLYAAIKCKCLIVTNDEMRDHIFQILGNDFFPRWKERHQESEKGHWHIPISTAHEGELKRIWLCAIRASSQNVTETLPKSSAESQLRESTNDASSNRERNQASLRRHINGKIASLHKYSSESRTSVCHKMISDLDAVEKLHGCVIDFQI